MAKLKKPKKKMSEAIAVEGEEELRKRVITELWRRGDLSYLFHSGQQQIINTIDSLPKSAKHVLLLISRRWGKSYLGCILAIQIALKKFYRRVLIIGPTKDQTANIINPIMHKIKLDDYNDLLVEGKSKLIWKVGRSEIMLAGFDTCLETVRGQEFDAIILEEPASSTVTKEQYDYIIKSILTPTLAHTNGPIYYMTTPSRDADHPVHTVTIPKTEASGTLFKFTIETNPLFTKEQIEQIIEDAGGRDDPAVKREYFCEIERNKAEVVAPNFDAAKNVKEFELPEMSNFWIGGDTGGVRDMTAIHLLAYDYKNSKILVVDELKFDRNTPSSTIAKEIKALEKKYNQTNLSKYIDAPGQIRVDFSRDHGILIAPPKKMKGGFEAGINQLNLACLHESLIIHPRCKFTIASLEHGRTNKQRTDYERTEDLGHCDAIASLIYGIRAANVKTPYPKYHDYKHISKDNLFINPRSSSDEADPLAKLLEF